MDGWVEDPVGWKVGNAECLGKKSRKLTLVVCGEASDVEEAAGRGAG